MSEKNGGPELLIRGHFSVYATEDGGVHLAMRLEGEDEDRHVPVSPMMLRMMPGGRDALKQLLERG